MSHKKEIYTTVLKALPNTNCFIDRSTTAEDYNRLAAAFYYLFNSDILTKGDYVHVFGVLSEKLPIYERGGDKEKFKELAVTYAEFGYPKNPDIRRVICDFIDHIDGISGALLARSVNALRARLEKCSDFVGTEALSHGFTLTPLTEKELATIKSIILVGK
ncbi:MAG: hypothetical protein E7609_03110 [Ruminococcaceae bacterium]|nr:hypothetical protein [Oscillospiraceae bacterium]